MEANRIVYLGAKGKRNTVLSTKGESSTFLRNNFSGLTPKLLANVRPFTENNIANQIKISNESIKVPVIMLGTELRVISYDSPVLLVNKRYQFNMVSPDPKNVGDVVGIMKQILFSGNPSTFYNHQGGVMHFAVDEGIKNARGVSVWLDVITKDNPSSDDSAYVNTVGMFMSLDRFFGSVNDHTQIVIPLGMRVVDEKEIDLQN